MNSPLPLESDPPKFTALNSCYIDYSQKCLIFFFALLHVQGKGELRNNA